MGPTLPNHSSTHGSSHGSHSACLEDGQERPTNSSAAMRRRGLSPGLSMDSHSSARNNVLRRYGGALESVAALRRRQDLPRQQAQHRERLMQRLRMAAAGARREHADTLWSARSCAPTSGRGVAEATIAGLAGTTQQRREPVQVACHVGLRQQVPTLASWLTTMASWLPSAKPPQIPSGQPHGPSGAAERGGYELIHVYGLSRHLTQQPLRGPTGGLNHR